MKTSRSAKYCQSVLCLLASIVLLCLPVNAQEEKDPKGNKVLGTILGLAVFEGVSCINAGMAVVAPEAYGAICVITSPVILKGRYHPALEITGMATLIALGTYNIIAPSNQDLSDSEIFTHNMVGAQIAMLSIITVSLFTPYTRTPEEKDFSIGLLPSADGPMWVAQLRF